MKGSKLFDILVVATFLILVVLAAIADGAQEAKESGILCEQQIEVN